MHDTLTYLEPTDFPSIRRGNLEVLQVNLGYLCNLSCTHCHVNAGPKRTELMDKPTVDLILDFIDRERIHKIDLTGGAPEMNTHFKYLVEKARSMGVQVIDRCNLVILQEPGYGKFSSLFGRQTKLKSLLLYLVIFKIMLTSNGGRVLLMPAFWR